MRENAQPESIQEITLVPRLDSLAAKALAEEMLAMRGAPLTIDAGEVEFAGALGLQVLVSAARQWQADGFHLKLGPVSPSFTTCCEDQGLTASDMSTRPEEKGGLS